MSNFLDPIVQYEMDVNEANAYKIGLIWLVLSRQLFPHYDHTSGYPKKGDPRKSILFKTCYTLINETKGLIPVDEYKQYILAQLKIIKSIKRNPYIAPSILIGEKAWIRWMVYKNKVDKLSNVSTKEESGLSLIPLEVIKTELGQTKKFLEFRLGKPPNKDEYDANISDICRWAEIGKLSPFYLILSPWMKVCKTDIDLSLYEKSISSDLINWFKEEFSYEFTA